MKTSRRIATHWMWPVLASLFSAALGFWLKSACSVSAWGSSAHTYANLCYSDLGPLYFARGLADGVLPYFEAYDNRFIEYPVLTGMVMWLIAWVTQFIVGDSSVAVFVGITWLTSAIALAVSVAYMARYRTSNVWAAWMLALSPAVVLTLGINWDSLAVLAAVVALMSWRRGNPVLAGIAIGVGTSAKLFPALLLVPIVAYALSHRQLQRGLQAVGAALATWLVINAPFIIFATEGWLEFFTFSRERGIDFGSLWLALRYIADVSITTSTANLIGLIAVGLTSLYIVVAGRKLDIYAAAFLIVSAFVLFNKVYSPQFWLWLTALLVMTRINRTLFVIWTVAELLYFVGIWRYLLYTVDPSVVGAINETVYGWLIMGHWVATAAVALSVSKLSK